MIIHFWGVRGSLPAPLTSLQIQSKINAVIQRVTPEDLVSLDAKTKFLAQLPDWIMGTVGGNTSCVEIKTDEAEELIFDAGSGLASYGHSNNLPSDHKYNFFFSHFHWDHIQGLPFFTPAFDPKSKIVFYSPFENSKQFLEKQMENPFFPVPFSSFTKNISFNSIKPDQGIFIGNTKINCCKMSHPGDSYSYSIENNGKKVVYATDIELKSRNFSNDESSCKTVFQDADCIILDSQYTVEEALQKENWGHSAYCYAIDFAVFWNIKKIYLFHHEPTYDDKKLYSILDSAKKYLKYINREDIQIEIAREDLEIEL